MDAAVDIASAASIHLSSDGSSSSSTRRITKGSVNQQCLQVAPVWLRDRVEKGEALPRVELITTTTTTTTGGGGSRRTKRAREKRAREAGEMMEYVMVMKRELFVEFLTMMQ